MIIGVDIRPLMEKEPSGVSQYLFNLLDNLFKIDRVNQYKLFYNSFRPVSLPAWQYPNVRFYGFRWPNKLLNFSFRFFSRPWVDRLLGGVDVFWLPNLSFIALSPEVKKVATVHDLSFELYPEFLSGWRELWHWVINPRRFFRQADKLIAVSEATRRDLAAVYGTPGGRVELVYSGVRQLESQRVRELESQGGLPEKFILTLGTREPRKNLIGVIKAWEKVKLESGDEGLGLVIAGGGGWLNDEANRLIARSQFKKEIKILGFVSEAVKLELYSRAEMFIYPSFYEGFGLPPLEAMSAGCPVIASLSSAVSEICGGAAVLVNPYQIGEMVEAMKSVRSPESGVRSRLIKAGLERVKELGWERAATETLKVLKEI